ncbi:MAG: hypothetical protein PVH12_00705 [Candidatus Bathyarchaeota archaeon]|jgi:hypothetical protein
MKALEIIYWLRFALGVTAALICIGYNLATNTIDNVTIETFINGLSIALVIYIVSYYAIRRIRFAEVVETPRKLMLTGIGIYISSWMVCWTLFYTIIVGIRT